MEITVWQWKSLCKSRGKRFIILPVSALAAWRRKAGVHKPC